MNAQQRKQHIERLKRERAVTVTAPSGLEYRVCRTSLDAYLNGGRLPENFVIAMKRVQREEITADQAFLEVTPQDEIGYAKFLNDLIRDSVIEPKIVMRPAASDDEMDLADIAAVGDYEWLVGYITRSIPDQPVQTETGETSVGALETFRDETGRDVSIESGSDGEQVQPTAI